MMKWFQCFRGRRMRRDRRCTSKPTQRSWNFSIANIRRKRRLTKMAWSRTSSNGTEAKNILMRHQNNYFSHRPWVPPLMLHSHHLFFITSTSSTLLPLLVTPTVTPPTFTSHLHTPPSHPTFTPHLHTPPSHPTFTPHLHTPPSHPTFTPHLHTPPSPPTFTPHLHTPPSPPTFTPHLHTPPHGSGSSQTLKFKLILLHQYHIKIKDIWKTN